MHRRSTRLAAKPEHGYKLKRIGFLLLMSATALCGHITATAGEKPSEGRSIGWRGDGSGRYPAANPPSDWNIDEGKNILWRIKVGGGQSSPIVVKDTVVLTAEPDLLLAVERQTGKLLWKKPHGLDALPPEIKLPQEPPETAEGCGYSTPTPTSDGKLVYACYGTGIAACYDLQGNRRWIRYLDLPQITQYGRSVSPVLADGKLLVSLSGLTALDPQTGETLWNTPEAKLSYGTPAVTKIDTESVAITPNGDCVRLSDGLILARKLAVTKYTSPVVDGGVVYFVDAPSVALKLPDKADEPLRFQKLWEAEDLEGEFFASPVCHEGILYCVCNEGVLYAIDAQTGKVVFQKEIDKIGSAGGRPDVGAANIYPSLTFVGKNLLLGNDAGEMLVLAAGREYREAACNRLARGSGASPFAAGRLLFLRAGAHLCCIGSR